MKKARISFLSLSLAVVICFSLALPASAVTYADADSIHADFQSSVKLMTNLGILNGSCSDGQTVFSPDGSMTRGSIAKIIAYMRLGRNISSIKGYYKGSSCKFADIGSSWARDYIAWCCDNGIIDGDGSGYYHPSAPVTYAQGLKLLLCAAGYASSRYTGKDWAKNALSDAYALGLFSQFSGTGAVDTEKLLVPDAEGKAVSAGSSCPRECFCSLASMALQHLAVRSSVQEPSLTVLSSGPDSLHTAADAAALDTLPATLGSNGFGLLGTGNLRCISVTGGTAVLTGTVTSSTAALSIAAGGTAVVTRYDSTMPIKLDAPSSGLRPGSEVSFALQTASTADTMTVAAGFTTVSSEQASGAVSYSDTAVSGTVIQADEVTNSGGLVAVSASDSAALGFAVTNTPTQGAAQNWEDQNEGTVNQSLLDITRSTVLAATVEYLVFNDTVTLNEAGSHVKTLSAAEARAYCADHPGITAVSLHGIVISLENSDSTAKKFPNTVLYFGGCANCVDSNNEPYWQIEVYGEGQFKTVNLKKLITVNNSGTITTDATTTNNIDSILNGASCKNAATTGTYQSIYVLHLASDLDGNLVAYSYALGSGNAAKEYVVSACNDENVRLTQVIKGVKASDTTDGIIAKSGDHAFGGCYDLTSPKGKFAAKALTLGDTVIAFFETADDNNYLRAAYVVSAAAEPDVEAE